MSALYETKRDCRPWLPDEETLLMNLRHRNPKMSWTRLTRVFNTEVAEQRHRSYDAITTKWKSLKARSLKAMVSSGPLSAQAPAKDNKSREKVKPYQVGQQLAESSQQNDIGSSTQLHDQSTSQELLESYSDIVDTDGYLEQAIHAFVLEEAKQSALRAASGVHNGWY